VVEEESVAPPGTPNNEEEEDVEEDEASIPKTPDEAAIVSEFSDTESPPKQIEMEE